MTKFLLVLSVALLVVCCEKPTVPSLEGELPPNATVSMLPAVKEGESVYVADNMTIAGRVTTCDRAGNIYKSFFVQDDSGGVEVLYDSYSIYSLYPLGCDVTLSLRGFWVGRHLGVLQVGLRNVGDDYFPIRAIESNVLLDRLVHCNAPTVGRTEPLAVEIDQLEAALCGVLVRIEGLTLVWQGDEPTVWSGYRIFENGLSEQVAVNTSAYADFADAEIPRDKTLSIMGVVHYDPVRKQYFIKMRDANDCSMRD